MSLNFLLLFLAFTGSAGAVVLKPHFCHAVTSSNHLPGPNGYRCDGTPRGYEKQWLWLRHELTPDERARTDWSLTIRQTRFRQLSVIFHYVDGRTNIHTVRAGDFGDHWALNAHLAFPAPSRDVELDSVTIGFQDLAAYDLLRVRLLPEPIRAREAGIVALLAGCALSLLFASLIYNLFLFGVAKQRSALWHSLWVACMIGWGAFWSQLALAVVPAAAGIASVRICAMLAAFAEAAATMLLLSSIEPGMLPRWGRISLRALAAAVVAAAALAIMPPAGTPSLLANILTIVVLALVIGVIMATGVAWRRGSRFARDFALAWSLPIAAVLYSIISDIVVTDTRIFSGELLVLLVGAFQTVWLSVRATFTLAAMRVERDRERSQRARFEQLAETDDLTGVYNRRGFLVRARQELARTDGKQRTVGLILADVDHFKRINDTHGHDVGDLVLRRIADALRALSGDVVVGRLGGEEFGLVVAGGLALDIFVEQVRETISAIDMTDIAATLPGVTASFGYVRASDHPDASFEPLLRAADQALYRAKALGRNRGVEGHPADVQRGEEEPRIGHDRRTHRSSPLSFRQ
ncbi:sensor domain-containing diguanylate cyclase [Sphingomonas oleivorans]|uniref:sensor domain-containing diguanylate cyclase n=1 Tax=Sphingomonas oleivorans TaxID=1735121 RepID=UPI0013FE28EB|nr:GGDEF domain-containing protein [Sphingomonas oleivorans]